MLPYRDSRLTKAVVGIFFLIVIVYAYFEARGLLFGPSITISGGESATSAAQYVLIQGQVAHIASLSVNGEPIQVTETGMFKEPYVLAPGANRIVFDAKDKYNHTTEKVVEIVYIPDATSTISTNSSSGTASTAPISASSTQSGTNSSAGITASSSSSTQNAIENPSPDVAPGR